MALREKNSVSDGKNQGTMLFQWRKTGDRHGIAGYLGQSKAFEEAMLRFARSYADQNERDYEVFCSQYIT